MLPAKEEIFVAIVVVSLLLIVLGLVVIAAVINYKRKQEGYLHRIRLMEEEFDKQLKWAQIEIQEQAFTILGQELHDDIGQLLSSTKLLIGVTQRNLPEVPDTLTTAENTLSQAIHNLRALAKSFNQQWLRQFNLIDNLKAEVERINAAHVIQVSFHFTDNLLPLQSEAQIMLFRIIQEAIQNSIKHAKPGTIKIQMDISGNRLQVNVVDDGVGINNQGTPARGIGVLTMRHRTHLLGGTIEWNSIESEGTAVCIQLPIESAPI